MEDGRRYDGCVTILFYRSKSAGEIFVSSRVTLACGRIEQPRKINKGVIKEKLVIVDRCYIGGRGGGGVIENFTKGERWKKDILIRVKIQTWKILIFTHFGEIEGFQDRRYSILLTTINRGDRIAEFHTPDTPIRQILFRLARWSFSFGTERENPLKRWLYLRQGARQESTTMPPS